VLVGDLLGLEVSPIVVIDEAGEDGVDITLLAALVEEASPEFGVIVPPITCGGTPTDLADLAPA
jgi:hypothetical protein